MFNSYTIIIWSSRIRIPTTCTGLIERIIIVQLIVSILLTIDHFDYLSPYQNNSVLMIPRLFIQLSVLVSYIFKVNFGFEIDVQSPIDVVRVSTVGNNSVECLEKQFGMPLVFWHKGSLESKLALLQSLSQQDVTVKRGKFTHTVFMTKIMR